MAPGARSCGQRSARMNTLNMIRSPSRKGEGLFLFRVSYEGHKDGLNEYVCGVNPAGPWFRSVDKTDEAPQRPV